MRFDLILFPLLGGYLFLVICPITKYLHQRIERQRLIFHAAIAGGIITTFTYWLRDLLARWDGAIISFFKSLMPSLVRDSGWNTLMATLPMGILLGLICWFFLSLNRKFNKPLFRSTRWVSNSVYYNGDDFDKLFLESFKNGWAIAITLKNGKVYVGEVLKIPKPSESNQLRILPLMSGYRHKEYQTLHFTTFYSKVYKYYMQKGISTARLKMDLLIDRGQIISTNRFDFDVYARFGKEQAHPQPLAAQKQPGAEAKEAEQDKAK
ncbi:MAG: hypothetical protein AAGB24_04565 [Bacteroidota bacterium]